MSRICTHANCQKEQVLITKAKYMESIANLIRNQRW